MGLVEGRAALVTGAAQGIGLAIARMLVEHGASVVIADLDADAARAAAESLPGSAVSVGCDVRSEEDVAAAVKLCVDQYGSADILVNNAGISRDATMRKMALEDFRSVVDVHLQGAWLGCKLGSQAMRKQPHGGSIVNISSISGKVGNPGQTNYSAAKAGIVGLTKAAAKELGYLGIRVNAVMPGLIRTPMTEAMPHQAWESKLAETPLGRPGEPEDVAGAVLFLTSDLATYITGIVLEVSGGRNL